MISLRAGTTLVGAILILLLLPGAALAADAVITADGIQPDPIVVAEGEAVVFSNATDGVVRLIADNGRWDSGDLEPGNGFSISFDVAGSQTFTSEDGAITGTIEVGDITATAAQEEEEVPAADAAAGDTTEEPASEEQASEEQGSEEPAAPSALAATGLPSAALAWAAALCTLLGILALRRTARR